MKKQVNTNPLREIIDLESVSIGNDGEFEYFTNYEKLECGHLQPIPEDIFGERPNAQKRRCSKCGELNK